MRMSHDNVLPMNVFFLSTFTHLHSAGLQLMLKNDELWEANDLIQGQF